MMTYRRRYRGHPLSASLAMFLLSLITAGAFGCGTVSYKLGGTHGDYQAARERCRDAGRTESPDFERCMKEQDWIVKHLGAPLAPSDAKKSVPAGPSGGLESSPVARDVVPPAGHGDPAPSAAHGNVTSVEHPTVVKSWFKLGGTADAFAAAKERCVAKLGAAHRPDPESQVVTGEMLDCLRNEGWRGLQSN